MPTFTQYRDPTDTTSGPSPIIWADCPTLEMMHDPGRGYHFFDDFLSGGLTPTITTTIASAPYTMFGGATITGVTMTVNGSPTNTNDDPTNFVRD